MTRSRVTLPAVACLLAGGFLTFSAESPCAELVRGFAVELKPSVTGEENVVDREVWELQVQFKPLRMIWTEITDPQTGRKEKELIWYLVYRVTNAPLDRPADMSDTQPVNDIDPPPGPPMFVPEFTLVTTDEGSQQIYPDVILPEAEAAIERRERQELKNAVDIVGPIPSARAAEGTEENVYYGVAMWRGVDPSTDSFLIYMSGFSSAYQIRDGADGKPVVWRKSIVQEYKRPGDEFDAKEIEIRPAGEPRWLYRPEEPLASITPAQ
jgi:hypothetical protein